MQGEIVVDLRAAVYDKLQRLSFRFFDAHASGSIINRVTGDVQSLRSFVDMVLIQVFILVLQFALAFAYMASLQLPLTLACLVTTPLLGIGAAWFSALVRPAYVRNRALVDKLIGVLSENVQGAQVIKGLGREPEEIAKFAAANDEVRDQQNWIFWRLSTFIPSLGFLSQVNLVVLLAYGGALVIHGQLALGSGLVVFAGLLQQFSNQVLKISDIANSVQTSLTGARRVFEVLDTPVEITNAEPDCLVRLPRARGEVRFENVQFDYVSEHSVLRGVDFKIAPGTCVAILGPTGSGKSALLSLIPRFYDPGEGRVLIDGHDVKCIELDDLRRNIGLVFQDSFLFSNTIAANIAFGQPTATAAQIERAAKLAQAHGFITGLPDGYQTVLGEGASNLSGGQRQRLAIARGAAAGAGHPPARRSDRRRRSRHGTRNPLRARRRDGGADHVYRGPPRQHAAARRPRDGARPWPHRGIRTPGGTAASSGWTLPARGRTPGRRRREPPVAGRRVSFLPSGALPLSLGAFPDSQTRKHMKPPVLLTLLAGVVLLAAAVPTAEARPAAKTAATPKPNGAQPSRDDVVRLQIFLDEQNFGPGRIDGGYGGFTKKSWMRYQESQGTTPKEEFDAKKFTSVDPIYTSYTVTKDDLAALGTVPSSLAEQAKAKTLPYTSMPELIGERYHVGVDFLKKLNAPKNLDALKEGDQVKVPNVVPPFNLAQVFAMRQYNAEREKAIRANIESKPKPVDKPKGTPTPAPGETPTVPAIPEAMPGPTVALSASPPPESAVPSPSPTVVPAADASPSPRVRFRSERARQQAGPHRRSRQLQPSGVPRQHQGELPRSPRRRTARGLFPDHARFHRDPDAQGQLEGRRQDPPAVLPLGQVRAALRQAQLQRLRTAARPEQSGRHHLDRA